MAKSKEEVQKSVMAMLLDDEPANTNIPANATETLLIDNLIPFSDHPFKLYEGERLDDMVRSIKEFGIITPIIVRPINDDRTFEILSGHNRTNAAKIAGLATVPVIIKTGLTDDEAELIVTETNLVQRSFGDLSHSQRAVALKRHMNAISKQGKRNDLINEIQKLSNPHEIVGNESCSLTGNKLKSLEKAGAQYGLSKNSVARYVRLTFLNATLLNRVDNEEIGLYPAVALSYISPEEQIELNQILDESRYKIDIKKAESLREFSKSKKLSNEKIKQILSGELNKKLKPKTAPPLRIKAKIYQKYFDGSTAQSEMEVIVDQALAEYFANRKNHEKEEST